MSPFLWQTALGLLVAMFLSPAAWARPGSPKLPERPEAEVDFVDSDHAIWNLRSLNDTIFREGYSPNAVILERSRRRVEAQAARIQPGGPSLGKVKVVGSRRSPPGSAYRLVIRGKEVALPSSE